MHIKCPCLGLGFYVNPPMLPPIVPGRGVVGHYIDRCITLLFLQWLTLLRGDVAKNQHSGIIATFHRLHMLYYNIICMGVTRMTRHGHRIKLLRTSSHSKSHIIVSYHDWVKLNIKLIASYIASIAISKIMWL